MHKCFPPLLLALLIPAGMAQAQIYKWVDKEGKTHYSDSEKEAAHATSGIPVPLIEKSASPASSSSASKAVSKPATPSSASSENQDATLKKKEKEFQARREAQLAKEKQEEENERSRKARCQDAQASLKTATDAYKVEQYRYIPIPYSINQAYEKMQQAEAAAKQACS